VEYNIDSLLYKSSITWSNGSYNSRQCVIWIYSVQANKDRLISGGGGTVNPLEASNQNRNLTEEIQRDLWEQFKPPEAKSYDEAKKAFETPQSVLDWRKWRDQQYAERKGYFPNGTRSNAAFLYDDNNNVAAEEEKYKPWTLR
jgi:hypothetical protein